MERDGAWRIPGISELESGRYLPLTMVGVPRWLDNLDAISVGAGGVLILVGVAAAPTVDVPGSTAASVLLGSLGVVSIVSAIRFAMTGLAVSAEGLRVRRFWRTWLIRWSDVAEIEITRAPNVWAERWEAMRLLTAGGQTVWVLKVRRPRAAKEAPLVDQRTKASYRSVADAARSLLDLRRALLA